MKSVYVVKPYIKQYSFDSFIQSFITIESRNIRNMFLAHFKRNIIVQCFMKYLERYVSHEFNMTITFTSLQYQGVSDISTYQVSIIILPTFSL